jgi:hypothetical protein
MFYFLTEGLTRGIKPRDPWKRDSFHPPLQAGELSNGVDGEVKSGKKMKGGGRGTWNKVFFVVR